MDSQPEHRVRVLRASAVERLIASRMAAMRRGIVGPGEAVGFPLGQRATEAPKVASATAHERASMTFIEWLRAREPDFFRNVPPVTGAICSPARKEYELKLAACGLAWHAGSSEQGEVTGRVESTE